MKLQDLKNLMANKAKPPEAPVEVIDTRLLDNVGGAIKVWGQWGMAFRGLGE